MLVMLAGWTLAAAGCALKAAPTQTQVVNQALPKTTIVPPAWRSTADSDVVTNGWLVTFNDPRLETLVAEAIAHNLDLREAVARVEIARQGVAVVGAQLWPHVNGQLAGHATYVNNTRDDKSEAIANSLGYAQVSWEPDLWGRFRSQRAASEATYQATALDYAFARQSLAATTAKSWYQAIETRQLVALAQQSVATYSQLLALVRIRRTAGRVADLDVAEASANLNTAETELSVATGLYADARRALELLLGRYPSAEIEISVKFATFPRPVAPGLPASLLTRRPDIIAAESRVLAAFRAKEAARLALLPTISLALDGGRVTDRVLELLHLNPWLVHGAIGAAVPIYEGGALRADIKIATAEQEEAVARYGAVVLRAFGEVETALTNERLLAQQTQSDQRALDDRIAAVRIAATKYNVGTIDLLSVLILEEAELETQASVIKLRNARLANRIDLHLALGGGFGAAPAAKP
jgi:NodT family efflux transporter outer membrane factor (OMF) lipoprotein